MERFFMLPLSKRQLAVLESLRAFARREGRMPSVRELAKELGLCCSTTHQHMQSLRKKGLLDIDGSSHGIKFSSKRYPKRRSKPSAENIVEVPLLGKIAAGVPIEAMELPEEPLLLSAAMAPEGAYALRVVGDSMIEDNILDGDLIVLRPQEHVERGEIAVALLEDGTATLKRIYPEPEKSRIRLQPSNEALDPLYVDQVRIQGKVVALLRFP